MISGELRAEIDRWIAIDAEHGTELTAMLARDPDGLATLFDGRIAFGTAGLRAEMGPGPRQMNRLVVQQTTVGLMAWLAAGAKVVIGYDARHHSRQFAYDVAAVVLANGGTAEIVDRPAPTPVLARAVLDREADAGVMITASHNPAADNGYKLYLGDGIQLVAPADAEIAAAIDEVAADGVAPLPDGGSAGLPAGVADIADEALARHRTEAIEALLTDRRDVQVLYTAMHGVGGRHLVAAFEDAGFPTPKLVAEQFEPDPDFPTAPFPNPEEPGAFDLSFAAASAAGPGGVDLIIANDPDADRLAVATTDETGTWFRLSGDQVGALLADHVLRHRRSKDAGGRHRGRYVMASSIVSSRFIDRLAAAAGADSIRTLTGFKWVARPIVERPEDDYLFGYEEALGYCIGDRVRDKDGISAALVMAELAADCKASGTPLMGRLDELVAEHGLYATSQVTISIADLDDEGRDRAKQRAVALAPDSVGRAAVAERIDLALGERLPPTSGVVLNLADGSRVIVRPSGTEPKIKAYLEVIEQVDGVQNAKEARRRAELRLQELARAVEALLIG